MRLSAKTLLPLFVAAWASASLDHPIESDTVHTLVRFEEVPPEASGIHWSHENAMSPERHLPETTGAGCAFLDYDNDGWMDIFLVNSGRSDFFVPTRPLKNGLFKNKGDGRFVEVTQQAGLEGGEFGMGVAVGDYNNDGRQDLFVSTYGRSFLYRNNGDGTFTDVASQAGVQGDGWFTSAVWFDFDNDGRLDLFLCSYVYYEKTLSRLCADELGRSRYCVPRLFKPAASRLFHNNGDGTFLDVSESSGVSKSLGKAFGVVATDVNNDRLIDLFVANDMVPNFLFINQGQGRFDEVGLWAGVAYSEAGTARSGMGCDAADYDGDGWQDLFVANINHQKFSLYKNLTDLTFAEASPEIAASTFFLSGWGLRFFDYDNDGDPDLFLVNGHPDDKVEEVESEVKYEEPLLLFENVGASFKDVSRSSGAVFDRKLAGRGMATGDFDNDGDLDALVLVNGGSPLLLRNQGGNSRHWLGIQLHSVRSNPSAIGALITWQAGGVRRSRLKNGGGSYLSSHDPREVLGLGKAARVEWLEIRWPSGQVDRLEGLTTDRYIRIREGAGVLGEQVATQL
ncbi:MAG: CRTAC1 family protein [Acidobacteriota bacterium]